VLQGYDIAGYPADLFHLQVMIHTVKNINLLMALMLVRLKRHSPNEGGVRFRNQCADSNS